MAKIICRHENVFRPEDIEYTAFMLQKGSLAVLPTSTIYGISCIYNNRDSIKRVYEIKQRPFHMPFIILVPDISWVYRLAENVNSAAESLIEKYWTGKNRQPLTLVLKKKYDQNSHSLSAGSNNMAAEFKTAEKPTIALRLDSLVEVTEILKICGPAISTSATLSGTELLPKTIKEVPHTIREGVNIVFDYGRKLNGAASTIVDVTETKPVLLREGGLKYADLIKAVK